MILRSPLNRLCAVFILASGLAAASCDKVPLLAPTNSTISLFAAQNALALNATTEVVATIVESSGTPVQNGTLITFTTTLGSIEPREARTNNGQVNVRFNSGGQSGTAEIRALSGGASVKDALKIDIGAILADNIQLSASSGTVSSSGGTVQLTATVVDKNNNRLPDLPVGFSTDAGTLSTTTVLTNSNGQATVSLTTTREAKVTARVGTKTADFTVRVNAAPVITVQVSPSSAVSTQPVTATVAPGSTSGALNNVVVNWGDGRSDQLGTITGSVSRSHEYCAPGPYNVTVTGTDVNGERANGSAGVAIGPLNFSISGPASAQERQTVTFTASGIPSGAIVTQFRWDFHDGPVEFGGTSKSHAWPIQGGYQVIATAISPQCGSVSTAETSIQIVRIP